MRYLHYIHIGKNWFYWFSDFDDKKIYRPYEGDGAVDKKMVLFAGEDVTKSKAKQMIKEMFPDYEPILSYPYHQGTKLNKDGSRPYKDTFAKDNYHQERNFMGKM